MQTLKKSLAVFLSLLMIMSVFSVTASAQGEVLYYEDEVLLPNLTPQGLDLIEFEATIDFDEFSEYLIEAFKTCPSNGVDISSFNIPYEKHSELIATICNNIPELFHLGNSFTFSYTDSGIKTIKPRDGQYLWTPEEYAQRMEICKKTGDKILYGIEDNADLSEYEKALLIHDRIATLCEYAYAELLDNTLSEIGQVYKMDGVLVDRKAVCNGYALAYTYLARRAGLKCYYCSSDLLNHGWNIVYIDEKPYHLDTTWDDPVRDMTGRVLHNNFLLSTNEFKADLSGHIKDGVIDYDETPSDTRFDNAFWRSTCDFRSAFIYINGTYYYYDTTPTYANPYAIKSTPASTLLDTSDDTTVLNTYNLSCEKEGVWWSNISLGSDGRNLFFNLSESVYKYNVTTKETTKFYEPTLGEGEKIYAFYYDGRYLTMDIATTSSYTGSAYNGRVKIEYPDPETCGASDHIWKVMVPAVEPTCTAAGNTIGRTCMACELEETATTVAATGHSYSAWTVVNASTCTVAGSEKQVCSKCDDVQTRSLALAAHEWEWVTDTAATCGVAGTKHQKCKNCTATQAENTTIPATGNHTFEWVTDKAATCAETGIKHEECTVCQTKKNENTVIDKTTDHNYVAVVTPVTCEANGYTTYTCSICKDTYTDNIIETTGHSYGDWTVVNASTCTVAGSEKQVCSKCNDVQTRSLALAAHEWEWVTDTAATCGVAGTKHQKCKNCTATQAENTQIPATGNHTFEWVTDKAATCAETGIKHEECTVCHTKKNENTVIDKTTDHNYVAVVTPVTCEADGYTTYTCSVCKDTYKDNIITATGHSFEWVTDKAATCAETGLRHEECTVCQTKRNENTVIAKTTDHNYVAVVTAPTCTADGYTTHTCSICKNTYTDNIIATTGHSFEWVTDTPASCGVAGVKHEECTKCDATRNIGTVIPAISEHNWQWVTDKAATCAETGLKHEECTVCNTKRSENTVIDKTTDHNYVESVTAPTCTAKGYTTYTCSVCGDNYTANETPMLDHSWEWITDTAATCGVAGTKHQKCKNCTATQAENTPIPATGDHTWKWVTDKAATCTETGLRHEKCTVCNTTRNENSVIPMVKHTYTVAQVSEDAKKSDATCGAPAVYYYSCAVCGSVADSDEYIFTSGSPTGEHTAVTVPAKAATCTEAGTSEYTECSVCGVVLTQPTEISALGHSDNDGDGICDNCGEQIGENNTGVKSFVQKIKDFFNRIVKFFKNLFK